MTFGTRWRGLAGVVALVALSHSGTATAQQRDAILITGSSTVYPFTKAVAEKLVAEAKIKPPKIDSTGTVYGYNLFCKGTGLAHPDLQNASRRMNGLEFSLCHKNVVREIIEIPIGYDGIVVAYRKEGGRVNLTRAQLWLAVAKEVPQGGQLVANPYSRWRQIDPSLPDWPIEVLGPPPTSGTRDSFTELVMNVACQQFEEVRAIGDAVRKRAVCTTVRGDGKWADSGEDDTKTVQRIVNSPVGLTGIFGYSFLAGNRAWLAGAAIEGVDDDPANIASGRYPIARPLFIYAKRANLALVPGLSGFLQAYVSENAMGADGYLVARGLVPLDPAQQQRVREAVKAQTIMLRRPGS